MLVAFWNNSEIKLMKSTNFNVSKDYFAIHDILKTRQEESPRRTALFGQISFHILSELNISIDTATSPSWIGIQVCFCSEADPVSTNPHELLQIPCKSLCSHSSRLLLCINSGAKKSSVDWAARVDTEKKQTNNWFPKPLPDTIREPSTLARWQRQHSVVLNPF